VILSRRKRNNVALIGESGVGKTAIVEGFAQQMGFQRPMLEVDASSLVEPEQFNDIRHAHTGVLCIDRLFDFPPAAAIVEPFIARGEIQCIATGARAGWLGRWFEIIEVLPPNEDEATAILTGLKPRYEKFHKVEFGPGTIEAAVYASSRFLAHRHLPDRALDLLDDAGSRNELKKSRVVVPEDIAQAIADRTALPLAAVNAILAQRPNGRLDRILRELSARVPFEGNGWVSFLAAYLARCSKEEAAKLIDAIRAANAVGSDEE
jgi:ATP-dependent Clp protease ATP-binding subunit ClpC